MTTSQRQVGSRYQTFGLIGAVIGVGTIIALTRSTLWIPEGPAFFDPAAWTDGRDVPTAAAALVRFVAVLLLAYAAVVLILTVVTRQRPEGLLGRLATALGGDVVRRTLGGSLLAFAATPGTAVAATTPPTSTPVETATMRQVETATMTRVPILTAMAPLIPESVLDAPNRDLTPTAPHHGDGGVEVEPDSWIVARGDHLWNIAAETVGERLSATPTTGQVADYWERLIDHNRHVLVDPDNPDLILPGQRFELPD